ncbi:MAG: hypothetical protein OXN83_03670 [Oligoflexia bacterium]|nr:hypothetical protein [Oligoflexia bacterium]
MYQNLKLNKLLFSLFVFSFLIFGFFNFSAFFIKKASAKSSIIFIKENKPARIFLYPGRVSLLTLPCPINKALLGSPKDIKAEIDNLNPKEIILLSKKWNSQTSNLILKCNDKVFLFNLIPSKSRHYDFVKVLGHIPTRPFKVKTALSQASSTNGFKRFRLKDFKILKLLDFSWEGKK